MRRVAILCLVYLVTGGTAHAVTRPDFEGSWVGTRQGTDVEWRVEADGRLRIDGRPGDYSVQGDTLIVRFDPPAQAQPTVLRETAVYRFVASIPPRGTARLYVYGFDLGKQGVQLVREAPQTATAEDASPPVPNPVPGQPLSAAVPGQRPPRAP